MASCRTIHVVTLVRRDLIVRGHEHQALNKHSMYLNRIADAHFAKQPSDSLHSDSQLYQCEGVWAAHCTRSQQGGHGLQWPLHLSFQPNTLPLVGVL